MPSVGSSLNSNGSAGTSHGSSSLNLRNLGANRSLVLVNGHRWVNGAGTRGFRDFVDLNTIPQAMIERVEVLQDGATAIYGADAIAGVVNLHTYKDFEGLRAKAYLGTSSESDRDTTNVDRPVWPRFRQHQPDVRCDLRRPGSDLHTGSVTDCGALERTGCRNSRRPVS